MNEKVPEPNKINEEDEEDDEDDEYIETPHQQFDD